MVRKALDKMDIPSAEKVANLEKRVKSLEVKVGKLTKELKAAKAPAKPAAKKTATKKPPAKKKTTAAAKKTTTRTKKTS